MRLWSLVCLDVRSTAYCRRKRLTYISVIEIENMRGRGRISARERTLTSERTVAHFFLAWGCLLHDHSDMNRLS
jgi:hypothetical protein